MPTKESLDQICKDVIQDRDDCQVQIFAFGFREHSKAHLQDKGNYEEVIKINRDIAQMIRLLLMKLVANDDSIVANNKRHPVG
jgi:hypothetical protein